jgi:SAM-dependent methyltransferase
MPDSVPYSRSARLYDLMYEGRDYSGAAAEIRALLSTQVPGASTLLDVGCGSGRHLELLADHYRVEGLDINPALLEVARARCPGVTMHEDDMTSFDLGRSFDAVTCLFSAIGHVGSVADMRRSLARMAAHLNSPGMLIVEPWFTPEGFWDGHLAANFHAGADTRLAWMYRQRREGRLSVLDIHYLVAAQGEPEHFVERQELGLFTREEMTAALEDAGLEVRYLESDLWDRGLYLGRRV